MAVGFTLLTPVLQRLLSQVVAKGTVIVLGTSEVPLLTPCPMTVGCTQIQSVLCVLLRGDCTVWAEDLQEGDRGLTLSDSFYSLLQDPDLIEL